MSIAAYDGLNFAVKEYAREAPALAATPLDAVVAALRASGLPASALAGAGGASGASAPAATAAAA